MFSPFQGVGRKSKSVSDYVWGMRIVNSDGELVEYNKDKDPEMMKAIQVKPNPHRASAAAVASAANAGLW